MIKLIKLCLVCCLMLRVTFVEADIKNYQEYIAALKELEEQYKAIDKTIDLSGCTMREVVKHLHDILQTRAHSKIGTAQEEDSYPALLKVNEVVYELYFHGTKDMPGNCRLKNKKKKMVKLG